MVAYGQPGAASHAARVRTLSKVIVVLTAVVATATLLTTILSATVSSAAQDFLDGVITDDAFRNRLAPLSTVQVLGGVATLATGVVTMIWMYRLGSNLRAAGRRTTWHPLFGVFGWFLPPFVLYVIPFLVLRELWKGSDPDSDAEGWRRSGESPLVWAWFALFGIIPTVLVFAQAGSLAAEGIPDTDLESVADSLNRFGGGDLAVALVNVVAAVVWILLVRQLTDRHTRLTREA
jgi:hypothetical protein